MNKRSLISLCVSVLLLVAFLLGLTIYERSSAAKEQALLATASIYVPTTASTPPTTTVPPAPESLKAPDFIVTNEAGKTYSMLNFQGKPTILCFWSSDNVDAIKELELFDSLYEQYQEQINFLMIHLSGKTEDQAAAQAFLSKQNYTFPVYFDTYGDAAKAYQITTVPTSHFIDADGALKARSKGNLDTSALPEALKRIGVTAVSK